MPRYKKETLLAMERAKHPEDNTPPAKTQSTTINLIQNYIYQLLN
jgi:hypothetical protein